MQAGRHEDAPSDPWSRTYADYDRYRHDQDEMIATSHAAVAPLVTAVKQAPPDLLVDVCTGQGGLLFNLLDSLSPETEVVALDMSLTIMHHNQRYLRERYRHRIVSLIACDVARIPIKSSVFPCAVSFGMANMLGKMPQGLREVVRILMPGGRFVFTHNHVEPQSEGWQHVMERHLREGGTGDIGYLGLEREFAKLMDSIGFRDYDIEVTRKVIGEPDRDQASGVFPYPNEPLWETLVLATK
jgi:SAM-dependent methyltransferase